MYKVGLKTGRRGYHLKKTNEIGIGAGKQKAPRKERRGLNEQVLLLERTGFVCLELQRL